MVHNETIQPPQEKTLSPEEERVVSFFELLIEIDHRKQGKSAQHNSAKEILHEA